MKNYLKYNSSQRKRRKCEHFLPARKRGTCYGNVAGWAAGWVGGWLSVTASIVQND